MMAQAEVDSTAMATTIGQLGNQIDRGHGGGETSNNNGGNNTSANNYTFPNLGRQSSIYSLTLDEFQNTLRENGKNFGSMNMDEFLNSIWTAEENLLHHENPNNNNHTGQSPTDGASASSTGTGTLAKQPSLTRQGSLTLPAPLCRKTVDEVWTEIQRTQLHEEPHQQHQSEQKQQDAANANQNTAQRQPTVGEMTLEDFLIKAGIVREQGGAGPILPTPLAAVPTVPPAQAQHQLQYGFTNPHSQFVPRPMMGMAAGQPMPSYQPMPDTGNGKRSNGYPAPTVVPSVGCYGGRVANGGPAAGGYGAGLSAVSPVSPDAMCGPGQVDNPAGQYGLDMAALRGRKRIIDGPVEKVVERRQRRMIKNRESAARSRARKQAYTVELEAELNQLREENAQLKHALAETERQRKQQFQEEQRVAPTKAQRAQELLRAMRRSGSCTL